jgi:hypothetical protein
VTLGNIAPLGITVTRRRQPFGHHQGDHAHLHLVGFRRRRPTRRAAPVQPLRQRALHELDAPRVLEQRPAAPLVGQQSRQPIPLLGGPAPLARQPRSRAEQVVAVANHVETSTG